MKKTLYTQLNRLRENAVPLVCILLAISVIAVPVVAETVSQTDDFEDQNADGWEGENFNVQATSGGTGSYSLVAEDGISSQEENPEWVDGPTIDLTESFTVKGTSQIVQDSERRAGFGIVRPAEDVNQTEGVILLFSDEFGQTYIANNNGEDPTGLETINTDYNDVWVNWKLESSGNGEVTATVWEVGETESQGETISRTMEPESGSFSIFTGISDFNRVVSLDEVTINGTEAEETDPTLRLDTGNYLEFGETQEYTVYDLVGEREIRNDVTDSANVTSGNTSVITVDQTTNELTATSDENVSTRVNITATYDGRTDIRQVTVAEQSIENLDVLPFLGRTGAIFLDRGFQMILVGLLLAIAATRVGGVFAGLGIYQMSLTAGWLIGWVPIGLAMVGLFATLFIGLNIAANIDYSVRR